MNLWIPSYLLRDVKIEQQLLTSGTYIELVGGMLCDVPCLDKPVFEWILKLF